MVPLPLQASARWRTACNGEKTMIALASFTLRTHIVPKKNAHTIRKRRGGFFIGRKEEAIQSQDQIAREVRQQYRGKVHQGDIFVLASFRKTRADCIGLLETILDAMEGIVYENDRQVVIFTASFSPKRFKKTDKNIPSATVSVGLLEKGDLEAMDTLCY